MKRALENLDEAGVTAWFVIAAMLAIMLMLGNSLWNWCRGFPVMSDRHRKCCAAQQTVRPPPAERPSDCANGP
jgi:hypothetical protein